MARRRRGGRRESRRRSAPEPRAEPQPAGAAALAAAVAVAASALYAATLCPTLPFGDGGELIAAADSFGVAHPPGYPLYTALGWLALQLPWGEPAARMNALSAVFGGLACGALAWLVRRHTRRAGAAVAAGLGLATSATFWRVSTVTEVYALHLFLAALLLCAASAVGRAATPAARRRALLLAGCCLGLGLGHHPTIVLVLPAAALLAARMNGAEEARGAPGWRRLLPAVSPAALAGAVLLALAIAALLDASLLLRARRDPAANWGRVTTLPALIDHVSASIYRVNDLGLAGLLRAAGWRELAGQLTWQLTPLALPLAALGFTGLRGAKPGAGERGAAAALMLAGAAFGLRYVTDDVEAFYLPLLLGLALAVGLGVGVLERHGRRAVRGLGLAAAVALPLAGALRSLPANDLRGFTAASDYAWDILNSLPPDAVLFVEVDDAFGVLYLHQVLGARPDLDVFNRAGVIFDDVADVEELAPRPGESVEAHRMRSEHAFVARLLRDRPHREVFYLGRPDGDLDAGQRLDPHGLLYRLRRADEPALDDAPLWASYREARVRRQAERSRDPFAQAIAATYPIARGEGRLAAGDRDGAFEALEEAAQLARRNSSAQNYIGTVFGSAGEYRRAITCFERAVALKPSAYLAWRNLGLAYELAGDLAGARDAWRRMARLDAFRAEARAELQRLGDAL